MKVNYMKKTKRVMSILLLLILMSAACLSGCGISDAEDNGKINVVATIFPEYDFLRQIGGDYINLSMLMTPGSESHSYEPTPKDIKAISSADMFVYVGGESDEWVDTILDAVDNKKTSIVTLMDCVSLVEEETVEGMAGEHTEEEHGKNEQEEKAEYDEHVWTSPKNAILICKKLCNTLCELDPEHKEQYTKNTDDYIKQLEELDNSLSEVVKSAVRTEIIVGDRFPFRYLVEEYGLTYYAAFPSCADDTEPNAATIAFLVDKVKSDKIPVVFHIELSNEKVCKAICEQTGAANRQLNAVHNIAKDDFNAGVTYIDLMKQNVEVLKEALGQK